MWALVWKDLVLELRRRDTVTSMVLFGVATLLVLRLSLIHI